MSTAQPVEPKSETLRAVYWRDEILQVMFWLQGEGFGAEINANLLERFLGVDARIGIQYLDLMVSEGLLERSADGHYLLSPRGREEGARIFSEEFAELTRPTHGECGEDCWCHSDPEEAEACLAERVGGHEH